jgi:hypothetical protein
VLEACVSLLRISPWKSHCDHPLAAHCDLPVVETSVVDIGFGERERILLAWLGSIYRDVLLIYSLEMILPSFDSKGECHDSFIYFYHLCCQ